MSSTFAALVGSEPNWIISAIAGAVLGALVIPAAKLLAYPIHRLRPHSFNGTWFSYHRSFIGGTQVLRYGKFQIRTGVMTRYVVKRYSAGGKPSKEGRLPAPILSFKGRMYDEGDHVVMSISATSHNETAMYRFVGRIPSNVSVVPGLWMSYDHDLNPTAGVAITCRHQLDDAVALRLLRELAVVDEGAIRVSRIVPALVDTESPGTE